MADISRSLPETPPRQMPAAANVPWNDVHGTDGQFRGHWNELGPVIYRWSAEERNGLAKSAARMLADLGTTFNVYSDVGGVGRPYELDPIPLLVSSEEWSRVSAGLKQRIRLLDLVLTDLYGPQKLLKDGLIPPDLVNASPAFLQHVRGVQPAGGHHLLTTGCDLVRSPSGNWLVLRDHTSAPGGIGQALENRSVTSSLLGEHFERMRIARLGEFLDTERTSLQGLLPSRGDMPNVVFLTPGFRHPSYFEHAYKARLLGFPLVEAADLTVRERRLFLKTLAGLRRIDVVVNRIGDDGLDPLEHWGQGGVGVPGLIESWRSGNVAIANAPGAGFCASPALMPFLPAISRKWLGEDIKLPFVETWWLGQHAIRKKVLDELHRFILMPAFKSDPLLPIKCSTLTLSAKKQWIATIESRPHDFVVQLDLTPGETASLEKAGIRSRPVVWRAFTQNTENGAVVLPGGLARMGKSGQAVQLWPSHAGFTKDVWIPAADGDGTARMEVRTPRPNKDRHPSALEVPSRIAEQLYWVGRYAERIELATRLLRVALRNLGGETGRLQQEKFTACLTLIRGGQLLPKNVIIQPSQALKTLGGLIHDSSARGGIPSLLRALLMNAAAARDRLSDDTWRLFNRLEGVVHGLGINPSVSTLLATLDQLILHLSAFSGMQAENMTRGQGWRFLEVGRRTERSLGCLGLLETSARDGNESAPLLDALLETCDSSMTYRRRHFSRPRFHEVVDLLFHDTTNPRAVAYQVSVIHHELDRFAGDPEFGLFPKIREHLNEIGKFLEGQSVDSETFGAMSGALEQFSDMLTQHYFSHSVRRVY